MSPQLDETMAVWDEPMPNVDQVLARLEYHWHWRVALLAERFAADSPPALHALFAIALSTQLIAAVEREQKAIEYDLMFGTGEGEPRGILNVGGTHSDTCPVCLNGGHCLEAIQAEWERKQPPAPAGPPPPPDPEDDPGMPF